VFGTAIAIAVPMISNYALRAVLKQREPK